MVRFRIRDHVDSGWISRALDTHPKLIELRRVLRDDHHFGEARSRRFTERLLTIVLDDFGEGYVTEMSARIDRVVVLRERLARLYEGVLRGEDLSHSPGHIEATFRELETELDGLHSPVDDIDTRALLRDDAVSEALSERAESEASLETVTPATTVPRRRRLAPEPSDMILEHRSREFFTQLYRLQLESGLTAIGPRRVLQPDPENFPSVEITPEGDAFGTYAELQSYLQLTGLTSQRRRGIVSLEAHHLLEDRLMAFLGITKDEGVCISLEADDHQYFSTEVPRHLPRKTYFDITDIYQAHAEVYDQASHPEWLEPVRAFLRQHRDRIRARYQSGDVPGSLEPDFERRRAAVFEFLDGL
jgi:hypothetical protein